MTANIAGALFNTLVLAFFVVVALGVALGAYAATHMKRMEERVEE
jgi:ABC-type spermidine/putrescine transport system permease subunit II